MIESVEVVGYGRPASEALAASVAAAKGGDPLSPVTVIVSSNFVGLSARRLLACELGSQSDEGPVGIANISFVTPFRLAEQVGAELLLDRRPITNPVLGAAVRRVLATDPGPFGPVRQHEATEEALAALFAELSNVDEQGIEAILEEGSTAAELAIRYHRAISAELDGFHTERDLALESAEHPELGARLASLGHLIWYLPAPVSPALAVFLGRVLRAAASATVIVGATGSEEADEPVWRTCAEVGVAPAPHDTIESPSGDRIVSVTDAAEEVREVCARVLAAVEHGVRPDRIAVFYPTPSPYLRVLEQQFEASGLVANGPDPRRLTESVAGRTLLAALELDAERWRRDRVMALLSGGPVRAGDGFARPSVWDSLTRRAGVVAELGDWRTKLALFRAGAQSRLDEVAPSDDADGWRRGRLIDEVSDTRQLESFIDGLVTGVRAVTAASGWRARCEAATELLHLLLGREHLHTTWPDRERDAFAGVEAALVRLATLDEIEPEAGAATFVRALRAELDVARGRRGRFGSGVLYGPISAAVGHDLDEVFILGAVEGLLPAQQRDDAMLPDRLRRASLDQLEMRGARLAHQQRAYLAALAAAPEGHRTITFARGSLRSSRSALPSRWLLDTASALVGRTVHATEFAELGEPFVEEVSSFSSGIVASARSSASTSVDERDLAMLATAVDVPSHPLAAVVAAGLDTHRKRRSSEFTEFDGNLAGVEGLLDERPMSPSRLETWAACGFRYFLRYVLGVTDRDDPEHLDDISALDRGSLIHGVLERFIDEAIEQGPPNPGVPWSAEHRERLHQIADEESADYEATGRTGRAVHWRLQRDVLAELLDQFLVDDNEFRSANGATPHAVELDLGVRTGAPVDFALPNGRVVSMRGQADRVDVSDHGVIVSDYKSGKQRKLEELPNDPFVAGRTLQLAMYSEGAMRETAKSTASAAYWLVERPGVGRLGYRWSDDLRQRFDELLVAITDGIADGVFAAVPGEWDLYRQTNEECAFCEYDPVCPRERGEHAELKSAAPELAVRVALSPRPSPTEAASS
ncbi:MAG: PD-(D/E)XK nuclease family protein [Ilumatobacter sp.]